MSDDLKAPTPWLAGFVHRWHAGTCAPWLAHTNDRIDGHGGRMAVLALHFWPDCSRDLLAACVTHDLGEYVAGDLPWSAKEHNEALAIAVSRTEKRALHDMGFGLRVSGKNTRRLKFLDRLDAYLWAQHHAPHMMDRDDWGTAREWLEREAVAVGVGL